MNRQRGVSLSSLMVAVVILSIAALLAMKVLPSVMEYGKIAKAVKAVSQDSSLKEAGVPEIRTAFGKRQEIDNFKAVSPQDLEITKEGGALVIAFAYQDKIPLFANVSLVIDYESTSAK